MYKKQKKYIKISIILLLCILVFTIPFQMNPGFTRKDIDNNLRSSADYESAGLIALWSGPLDTIPAGWKLCNGTDGTINTSSLFVFSTDSMEAPGATGGHTTHNHSYSTVPYHDHGVTGTTTTPHDHSYSYPYYYRTVGQPEALITFTALSTAARSSGTSDAPHSHTMQSSGATPPLYTSEEENIIPPYYGMAFIEKEASDTPIPIGMIVMWGGDIDSIPAGWELCNGSNGTPDLQNRFIRGVTSGEDPGMLGGTIAHNHTYTQIPSHTHSIGTSIGGAHSHGDTYGKDITVGWDWLGLKPVFTPTGGYTDYENVPHTHSVPTVGLLTCTTEDTENQPPYFTVAFIMSTLATEQLPLGAITMWGDSIASIPSGWYQCNGTNGTPNMLNRFPIGLVNGEQAGLVGGETTHRHVYTEVPEHTHILNSDNMRHRHSLRTASGSTNWGLSASTHCPASWGSALTWNTASSSPSHYHDIAPTGSETCYTSYENSIPPYVKLIYMQKGQSFISPTPANGATDINYNPTLSVNVVDKEGDDLTVTFYDASDDSLIGQDFVSGGNGIASEIWSGLSSDTVYSWYVKIDDGSTITTSPTWSFTTNYAPGVPTNPTPIDGATDINFNPTLSVDVFDNDGDLLNVSFYNSASDAMIGWVYIFEGSGTASAPWSGLTNDTIYSWYVKSNDGLSVTTSATWSFTTNYAPGVPVNPTPIDGATRVNYSPLLRVDVLDDDRDDLNVSFYDAFDDSLIDSELVIGGNGTASVTWSGLSSDTNYSWYAISDDGLNIRRSATWSFTTNYAPDAPINPTPNDGTTDIGSALAPWTTLSVDVSDFDGDVLTVSFYDASDDSLIDSEQVLGGSGTANVTWPGLSSATSYSWYAKSDDGLSVTQSATWSFTTATWVENHLPEVTNPTPEHGDTGVAASPNLSVDISDTDGDTVTVTFYNSSDNSVIGQDIVTGGSGTASVTWSGVTSGNTYQWHVTADDGKGATQSSKWTFDTIKSSPPPDYTAIIIGSSIGGAALIGVASIYFIRRKRKG